MNQNSGNLFKEWHWTECLECLDDALRHSDNIILVSGELDSGKTTLKEELINTLANNVKIFTMLGEQRIGIASLIKQVSFGFGVACNDNLTMDWSELQKTIFSQPNYQWVLLIDDAEKLSWDALNALIRLYTIVNSEGGKFNLILFAHLSLEESLKHSVLKDFFDNKFQVISLKPLTFDQMMKFLNSLNFNFDHRTLKKIYTASDGFIGKVKQLAISELTIKSFDNQFVLKDLLKYIINPSAIKIIACGGLLVVVYFLFGIMQRIPQVVEQAAIEPVTESTTIIAQEEPIIKEHQAVSEQTKELVTEPQIAENSSNISYEELYQKLYADLKTSLQEQVQHEISKLESKLKVEPMQSSTKPRYTLQLMASKNEQSVKNLFNNYPVLSSKAKYFNGKFNKQQKNSWFVVVYGNYTNREAAVKDIKNLPLGLQNLKPIPRNYDYIYQLVNNLSSDKK